MKVHEPVTIVVCCIGVMCLTYWFDRPDPPPKPPAEIMVHEVVGGYAFESKNSWETTHDYSLTHCQEMTMFAGAGPAGAVYVKCLPIGKP